MSSWCPLLAAGNGETSMGIVWGFPYKNKPHDFTQGKSHVCEKQVTICVLHTFSMWLWNIFMVMNLETHQYWNVKPMGWKKYVKHVFHLKLTCEKHVWNQCGITCKAYVKPRGYIWTKMGNPCKTTHRNSMSATHVGYHVTLCEEYVEPMWLFSSLLCCISMIPCIMIGWG